MARRAHEYPVRYGDREATVSFGESAVRLFDRSTYALFKTFPDRTAVRLELDGRRLTIADGVETVDVTEDGVDLSTIIAESGPAGRSPGSGPETPIPIATTPTLAGREVVATLGIVGGSAVVSADAIANAPSAARAPRLEQELTNARRIAFAEMRAQAALGDADAVVGVHVSHDRTGADGASILVTAVGTAVRLG